MSDWETVYDYLTQCVPCGEQYIVMPEKKEKVLKGGIVRADESREEEKEQAGLIVAVGPGRLPEAGTERQPMEFVLGDTVLFKKYAGDDFYMDKELERYPSHTAPREDLIPVKILRQDSILTYLP